MVERDRNKYIYIYIAYSKLFVFKTNTKLLFVVIENLLKVIICFTVSLFSQEARG